MLRSKNLGTEGRTRIQLEMREVDEPLTLDLKWRIVREERKRGTAKSI